MEDRKPDEVKSWEFLAEHLYQWALKGGYQGEFAICKAHLPMLGQFHSLKDFIQSVEKDRSLKERVVKSIKTIWKSRYEMRPALGTVLLLTIWQDIPQSRPDKFYYDLFIRLSENIQ